MKRRKKIELTTEERRERRRRRKEKRQRPMEENEGSVREQRGRRAELERPTFQPKGKWPKIINKAEGKRAGAYVKAYYRNDKDESWSGGWVSTLGRMIEAFKSNDRRDTWKFKRYKLVPWKKPRKKRRKRHGDGEDDS